MNSTALQNRSIYHDLLRIFASLAVICIHVCANSETWASHNFSTSTWTFLNIFNSLSRFCVPVFVMLSGCFMLDKYKEGSLKRLYKKNILRLVCSFTFWSAVYVAFEIFNQLTQHNPLDIKALIYQLIQGEFHLWFIPMLIFLYVITPLVKELCNSKKNEQYFLLLACIPIIFNFTKSFITIPPINELFGYSGFQFVSGYTVYYISGHYLTKYDICKKYRIMIYLSAVISLVATVLISDWNYSIKLAGSHFVFEYLSPTVFIVSVAVFLLFKYGLSKIPFKEKSQKIIVKLSSLTFGIYLSHMIFVYLFIKSSLTVENIHPLVSIPLIVLVVFICSLATTWIISKIPILKKYII